MKLRPSILMVVAILTIWSTSQIEGAWWDPFVSGTSSCSKVGFFVNSQDCSKFYRCVHFQFEDPVHSPNEGWAPPTKGWSPPPKVGWSKRSIPDSDDSDTGRFKRSEGWAPPTKAPKVGWAAPTKGWPAVPTVKRDLLVRYDFDCPCGTVFDESVSVCVYPGPSGCAGGWSSGDGWTPSSKSSPPKVSCNQGWSPPKGWSPEPKPKGWSPPPPPKPKGWTAPAPKPKGWTPPQPKSEGWTPPASVPLSQFSGVLRRDGRPSKGVYLVREGRSFTPASSSFEIVYDNERGGSSEEF